MAFSFDELKFARDRGYSDDEIWNIISSENKEIGLAKERGYSLDEVASIESGQPMPSVEVPEPEPIEERGIARAAGDVGVAFTQGGVRGFRSLTDLFGAGNPASTTLRGVEDYVGNLLSAQAKKDQWEVSRILTEAQDKGIYDQLIAGVEAFATAPVLTTAGAAGSIAVNLLGGITANAASLGIRGIALGARGMMASQAAIGAAQGAGIIKGEIYDATEKYLLEQGMSPEIAKQGASEAQSFGGKNLDSILLGTGLGAAAAMTGVEKVARNVILRQGGIPTTKAITRFVTGTLEEMVPEAAQGGQEQLAKNLALQREGADVPTMRGVVGSAALEGLAGGALGGPTKLLFGKSKGKTPEIIEEEEIDSTSDQVADELEKEPVSPATEMAMKRMQFQSQIDNLTTEIEEDELLLQTIEQTSPDRQRAELALSGKKTALANIISEFNTIPKEELSETITPATATKETTIARIDELNKEFDALDENDQVGIDRLNKQIFAEQNKLAGLTAIEQGIDPQGTTPTREMGLPPSGRRSEFGTFFPDRPVLQAFVKATDKVLGAITVTSKRAQKLKNAIRTGIANNAGFLAGTNTEVISSEEYGKLTGGKQVAADTGTYRATFFNGKKYLVVPDVNQLAGISIEGEQRAANRDAALDQEARAASKKLEEEVIHLSMFQGIQDEYKNIKKPKFSEKEYIVKRISDIAKEVKRTNPNALPGVSEVYLNQKNRLLDDMTFSQEFMRMVIQRVRTGQITEDLNAIRKAEQEAFSDQDKGLITAWKNSILNALKFVRNSLARYLGKGTSTREVKRMEDSINAILDEYGIVKGEANYEFKDYSAAEPKGELKAEPTTIVEQEQVVPAGKTYAQLENEALDIQSKINEEAGVSALIGVSDDSITLSGLESQEKGKGTRALEIITQEADKNNTPVSLKAESKTGETQRLKRFYMRFGFVNDPSFSPESNRMIRYPNAVPAITPAPVSETPATTVSETITTTEEAALEEEAGEPTGGIEARASYYQNFEVFDKNGENRREEQIVVEADTPAQAEQLIRNTPKYQGLAQRNKAKKIRLFPMGQVERYRLPGEFPIIARAGVTPTNADPLGNVRDQFGPRASGHINDNTPEERILGESQALQRGYPEEFATISAKKTILGELSKTATGLRQTLWEHLGDLYHRAGSTTDYGSMVEKVNKFIRWSKNPKEFENQLKSNAIYQATVEKYGNNYTAEAFKEVNESAEGRKAIEDASRKIRYMDVAFASMYEKLQAFTPLQAMGRNMAIAFGLRRYDVAEQLGKSILSAIESRGDSVVKYGFNYEGVNNLSRSNNQTKQQFDSITKAAEIVKNDPLRSIEFFKQVSDRITDEELLAPIAMMEGQPIEARAGVTPEGEPISKRGQSIMQKITTRMIADLEAQVEMLKPKKNKAYTEYKSRTTKKGKTYNQALISPFSLAANLFTSNSFTEANNALNKIVRGNPDADFFDIAQGLAGTDAAEAQRRYGIDQNERFVLMDMIYSLLPAFRKEVDDSGMKATARDSFRLDALNVEAKLAQNIALAAQSGGQIVGYARVLRKLVGAGMAILTYKRGIIDSMGSLAKATNTSFNDVANAIRGDRRKSMDKVFNTKEVFKKAVSMIKMAQRNPEKVRQAIRAEVSKKQNLKTTDILLQFASGLFDTKEDKYANMVLDQTVQNILSIGMNKKEFSIDNVTKFMYQSFATAAKQLGIEKAGVEKPKRGKRSGKYMEMVKAVIGNDNAYKSFVNDLASRMAEKYQSRDAFNADFAELFTALRSNEWADGLREQAIKDTAQFLNYKFSDLFTYLGSQRNVNQEAVKQHIRAELQGTGASNELIEKFIQDTDKYLNEETSRILQDKLGFRIDEKTGKVIPKPLLSSKIKEEAEEQFKAIKNLKDISKLSTSDEGNFIEALISRIITEVGMDKEQATELATLISTQMEKAMLAQRSENVDRAIKDAQEILNSNGVKPKTNQRTVLQKLIEMANMGVLDAEGVYEAFRKTHDFPKGFLPYDADFTNTLREWGDRISKLPPGVIRSIEEEKMGRALMEKSKFTTGDILSSYWYFSLLSQVATQGINALSGASNLMANVAVWSLYKPKSFFPMMRAMYHAIDGRKSPAVNSFLYVMRNGLNPSGMQDEKRAKYPKTNVLESATPENTPKIVYYLTNFGDGKINFLPDWMNTALKNVNPRQLMRVLRATDMFLREVAYEAKAAQIGAADFSREGFDMAKRQAESELFSSDATGKQKEQEIIIRANEIYREQRLDETGRAIAEQASLETAFNQQPVGLFGLLANFVNSLLGKYPATKFVIPFTNVVANVTNEFINYTPVFSQIRLIGSKRRGVNDPFTQGSAEKQMEMQIKGFIGLAAMAVPFIIQALTGGDEEDQEERPYIQFYAEGPKDPRQKKIWQQRGGQKYSVRVGNTYFSYLPTPLVIPLAMGAMLQEEIKSMNKKGEKVQSEDIGKLAASVLTAPFSVGFVAVLNQSFLTGLADLLEFKESQNPVEKGTQVVGGILSRMAVPGVFRDINKLYTEDKAIGGDYLSNFLKDFPGSVNFLNKDVNYFGDDAKFPSAVREEGFGKRLASVVGRIVSTEQPDPAFEVMYRNNLTPPSWDASLSWDNGKRMTKEQELQFIREAGPLMRERIVEVSDELDELPIDEAQDLLSTEIRIIRREVKEDLQDRLEIPLDIQ